MRTNSINVEIKLDFPYEQPDRNGVLYSKNAIRKAFENLESNTPLIFRNNEGDSFAIGYVNNDIVTLEFDDKKHICSAYLDGTLLAGGTECIVNNIDENGFIDDFTITSVGMSIN